MQDNARKITYGAMMIALFAILLAVSLYTPLVGIVTMFFIPLPIILYRLRYDRTSSLLVHWYRYRVVLIDWRHFTCAICLRLWASWVYYWGNNYDGQNQNYISSWLLDLLCLLLGCVMYVGAVLFFGFNMIDELMTVMEDTQEQITSFMANIWWLTGNYDEIVEFNDSRMYEHTIPSIFIISVFMLAFIIVTLNFGVAKRLGL